MVPVAMTLERKDDTGHQGSQGDGIEPGGKANKSKSLIAGSYAPRDYCKMTAAINSCMSRSLWLRMREATVAACYCWDNMLVIVDE